MPTKFKPTINQQKALDAQHSDILVSASAGSGKTRILVDRIIQRLLAGQSIDHYLIVTFTEAAAREMKVRLTQTIREQLPKIADPSLRQHLSHQLALIPGAYISTLHAFCLRVIQKFYYLIDLNPTFRLLSDDNERFLLEERAWDQLRRHYYQAEDTDFFALENNFVTGINDDQMAQVIFQLTNFVLTNQDSQAWLAQLPQQYVMNDELTQTDFYQKQFQPTLTQQLEFLLLQLEQAEHYVQQHEQLASYQASIQTLQHQLQQLKMQLSASSWDELCQQVQALSPIKGRARAKTPAETVAPLNDFKKSINPTIEDWQYKFFALKNHDWQLILRKSQQLIEKLVEVEKQFLKKFQQEKQRQHCLDFNDLEHYTLQILQTQKEGHFLARDYYRDLFAEILIDEYQDTNPLQEAIIQQFKQQTPGNLFMVGDVKQSIYGFRQAAPYLFTNKYHQMQTDPQAGQLINLAENFRSSTNVIATINAIFERIMDQTIGDVDYTTTTKLVAGGNFPPEIEDGTEIYLQQTVDAAQITTDQAEIRLVIQRIQELMAQKYEVYDRQTGHKRPIEYRDIAILTRTKSWNNDLINQMSQAHLPVVVQDAANYFQATEVQVMLSMLQIIDNPHQDIALVAVLRSALVGLNENELAYLRINNRTGNYYEALISYLHDPVYNQANAFAKALTKKVTAFVEQLSDFRDLVSKMSIAELIWQIYLKTGYLSYVRGLPNGIQRVANLHALYQRADQFEKMEFKGLFQFIRFIQHIQDNDHDLARPTTFQPDQNEIQVMTIHGSKGLEFPVVFLLNINHHFNTDDLKKKYLLDAQQGIGLKYLDPQTRITYETLPLTAMKAKQQKKILSEEIRLLYVALTRAQQKLILVGAIKDDLKTAWSKWQIPLHLQSSGVISTAIRLQFNSFQAMLQYVWRQNGQLRDEQTAVATPQSPFHFTLHFVAQTPSIVTAVPDEQANSQPSKSISQVADTFSNTAQTILQLQYPHQAATQTTAYQAVSEIKHVFAQPEDQHLPIIDTQANQGNRYIMNDFNRPRFLTTEQNNVRPADIGTAVHLLLQQISLTTVPTAADFRTLAQQLIDQHLLMPAVASQIDYQSLEDFYASDLGQTIWQQRHSLKREWPFSMLIPARDVFTNFQQTDLEQVLVHGIVDGWFYDAHQQITVFDYKTDYLNLNLKEGNHSLSQAVNNYRGQLQLYQQAIESVTQQNVVHKYLCFLSINQTISVD